MKSYFRKFKLFLKKRKKVNNLRKRIFQSSADLRVVVGSADIFDEDWIPTNIDTLNLLKEANWKSLFKHKKLSAILAEHVWEHLSIDDGRRAARNCYEYLKPGGYLRIAVPDGFNPDDQYIDYVKVGGSGSGAFDHKVLYTYKSLKMILNESGFNVYLLEYFDEHGQFHYIEWEPSDGKIHRSKRFDERNKDGILVYTSLIVDAVKPD
jgi:predicted SAM-dependent methyltransferase